MPAIRKLAWVLLTVCALTAFLAFAYPMYVIRPFRAQEAGELTAALLVRRWGPPVAIVAALGALLLLGILWRNTRWLSRVGSGLLALLTAGFTALAHVNVYEQMFHPIPAAGFVAASSAKLETDDMVLAVKIGAESHAYPIRLMGYHHIVNDWLAGVPLVGTY